MRCILLLGFALVAGCNPKPTPQSTPSSKPESNDPIPQSPFELKPVVSRTVPIPWSSEMQAIADGNNAFACDLFAQLRSVPGNLFFSPFSIHTALAMAADGAQGETLDEMVKVLHLPKEAKSRLAAGDVARYYALGGDGYDLAVANNLWGQTGYPWKADFLERQRTGYGAELTSMDFKDPANREAVRKTINASIEKATRGKIKELLKKDPPDLTALTRLVLTNAIYFKGEWLAEFDKRATKDAPFTLADGTKKEVSLMSLGAKFRYMETDELQAVELPYKGNAISMVVLLPRKHDGLPALEKQLSAKELDAWIKKLGPAAVNLSLPKFKSENRIQLSDVLSRKMGMKLAFDPLKADLSGVNDGGGLHISKVIHQSFVEVNEEGTEAAAATGATFEPTSRPPPPKVFRADHPFVYLIRDTKTSNILFLGRYVGP